jgi:uncharacterized protein
MVEITERLNISRLFELCKKYSVTSLSVFGSALREDFNETSDIDFLVDFGPTATFSPSSQFFGLLFELQDLYGRKVDLVERSGIKNPYFKQSVEENEVRVYAA